MANPDTAMLRWDNWSITAPKDELENLLEVLDKSLPAGWRTQTADDIFGSTLHVGSPQVARCYQLAQTPTKSGITLGIEMRDPGVLRGGTLLAEYSGISAGKKYEQFAGDELERFLDEGLLPAAQNSGLTVRKGTAAEIFFEKLPFEVRESLHEFDRVARKTLPFEWAESAAWQAFVIAAQRGPDNVDYTLLGDWLKSRGWPAQHADELSERFFDQLQLLSRYRDSLVIA